LVSTLIKAYGAVENQKLMIELQKFEALDEIKTALKDMQKRGVMNMVEKDVKAIKSAIESMKASNWANKNEIIKQLEENLDAQYDEIAEESYSTGYEEAQGLIKSSDWGESEKERVLELLSEINEAEQVEEREGQKARTAAIQKMIAKDPSFFAIAKLARSTGRALKSGVISEGDAYKLLSYALETEGLKS